MLCASKRARHFSSSRDKPSRWRTHPKPQTPTPTRALAKLRAKRGRHVAFSFPLLSCRSPMSNPAMCAMSSVLATHHHAARCGAVRRENAWIAPAMGGFSQARRGGGRDELSAAGLGRFLGYATADHKNKNHEVLIFFGASNGDRSRIRDGMMWLCVCVRWTTSSRRGCSWGCRSTR